MAAPLRLRPADLAFPAAVEELFGRAAPLVVEIGFGNATFLGEMAADHPHWNVLGVEIAAASLLRGIGVVRRLRLPHVRLFGGDARGLVREVLPAESVHRVYVNFPDPWPKDRHQERRLLQEPFFRMVSTRLQPGGELWFTSDHEEYFDFAVEEGRRSGCFSIEIDTPPEEILRTKYARRWQERRKKIQHARFRCQRPDADPHPPRLEIVAMAHARLEGELPKSVDFEKRVRETAHGHVVLRDLLRSLDGERLVFAVMVDEADLHQDLLVEVRQSKSGSVYVEPLSFAAPASTPGVRAAVDEVAQVLVGWGLRRVEEGPS